MATLAWTSETAHRVTNRAQVIKTVHQATHRARTIEQGRNDVAAYFYALPSVGHRFALYFGLP